MEALEQMYRDACASGSVDVEEDDLAEDEMPDGKTTEPEHGEASNECLNLLQSMQEEARNIQADAEAVDVNDDESQKVPDPDLADLPDLGKVEQILEPTLDPLKQIDTAGLPVSLRDAISRPGDLFNSLWRYAVKLRSVPGGCDTGFLPNGQNCRRASRKLTWHQ